MESDSNKWFRDKWNKFDQSKYIEDNWFRVFNDNMEDIILDKHLKLIKKLEMKKNKQTILDEFDKSMKRDKSKDIIVGNPFHKNDRFQKEMFNNMFYEKMRDFFSSYLLNMNKDERDYLDEKSKNIKVRKCFECIFNLFIKYLN